MTNKAPIIKGQMATLTTQAKDLMPEVGINPKRTKGIKVMITQHALVGTSFTFINFTHEFHIPNRMVGECFVETSRY